MTEFAATHTITAKALLVEREGTLKQIGLKNVAEGELYKKCGFKSASHFDKRTTYKVKYMGDKYLVTVYAKDEGRANTENKYDFPPPIDKALYFGACLLVAREYGGGSASSTPSYVDLLPAMWQKMYEKLFGGFEDLGKHSAEDEMEVDELAAVPRHLKTKEGYLKDGFVVGSDEEEDAVTASSGEYQSEELSFVTGEQDDEEETSVEAEEEEEEEEDDTPDLSGGELEEEAYDYDDVQV